MHGTARNNKRILGRMIDVTVGGQTAQTDDWSIGGIAVTLQDVSEFKVGRKINGYVGPQADEKLAFVAEVVRVDPASNRIAFRFVQKGPDIFDYMEMAQMGRYRSARRPAATMVHAVA